MFYSRKTSKQVNRMLKDILFWFIIVTGILSPFSSYAATAFWPALLCMLFFF